jgi:hypothetical protein
MLRLQQTCQRKDNDEPAVLFNNEYQKDVNEKGISGLRQRMFAF